MRLLIFDLQPPPLESGGLAAAVQALLMAFEGRDGLRTEFRIEGDRPLPMAVETELYWIAHEALVNVRKHAAARHVLVHLRLTATTVSLEVQDDGVGFDPQVVPAERRGGLRIIAERTERISGEMTYESAPGQGTRMEIDVVL